jgi:hypothetical protein
MKQIYVYIAAFLVLVSTGCKKDFLNVNTNPNSLPTATPSFVISNAMNVTASSLVGPNELGMMWSGHWTQSNGYILATTTFQYQFTNNDYNYWDGTYDNLYDYKFVLDNAAAYKQEYLLGPAKIMMAFNFQKLVDLYGNIPYTDALQGVKILAPKFDEQKTVYENLIVLIDGAIADLKKYPYESTNASADIIFKGSNTNWIKFANSLKLRILMRQSRISGRDSYITTEINKINSEGSGFITGAEVGVNPGYNASAGQINPFYNAYGYSETGARIASNNFPRITEFTVNTLKATGDTFRLKRVAYAVGNEDAANPGVSLKPEISANYVGTPFGVGSGYLPTNTSAVGPAFLTKGVFNKPFVIMTAAEIQFNLAEAKQRYGSNVSLTGTAKSYYEEGIKQSYRALGANTSGLTAFLASGVQDVDFDASTNKLNAIAYQKWFALGYFNGLEAWSEYRKSGYPVTPQSRAVTSASRPLRLYYPGTELGSNGTNVNAQGTIDPLTTRIFWDID